MEDYRQYLSKILDMENNIWMSMSYAFDFVVPVRLYIYIHILNMCMCVSSDGMT